MVVECYSTEAEELLDLTTELGVRAAKRLKEEYVVWLTTVTPNGSPQPNPVWFYWDGNAMITYTQPSAHKVRNIVNNPNVSVNFQADNEGGDIIVLTGTASVDKHPPKHDPRYIEKYHEEIPKIGLNPESLAASYSVQITVTPTKLRGL